MIVPLFPPPQKLKFSQNMLDLKPRQYIKIVSNHSDNFLDALRRFVAACPQTFELTYGNVSDDEIALSVRLLSRGKGPKANEEGYEVTTSNAGLALAAATEVGLFRGLMSIQQLLASCPTRLPFTTITDSPDLTERGVMLDVSRCKVPSIETLKTLIDSFAMLKFNQLQLYTEHTFAFSNHPLVWANASPYTAAETLEIKSYCNARYIDLVPNLNCFGHFERWLRHPEYQHLAECPDGFSHPFSGKHIEFGSTLKPNRQSLKLLNELHAEYLPLFDSPYFNIGGDEPWELGQGWSKAQCEARGTTNVYVDFISDIQKLTEKRGRQMMFWSDIVLREPESLKRLSKDLTALNWGYEGNHPFARECRQVAAEKIPFYVCPGTSSWNSLTGRISNMVSNIDNAARNGIKHGAKGLLVTDWGDYGHHQYLPVSYPGFALAGCHSWNHKASRKIDLIQLVNQIYFREPASAPNAATLLCELGKVLDLAPSPLRNASIFNRLLFWGMKGEPTVTREISDRALSRCLDSFDDITARLPEIQCDDRDLVIAELGNSIALASHGIHRLQKFRGKGLDTHTLKTALDQATAAHERLWLSRNRPGGLRESVEHLLTSRAALVGSAD